MVFTSRGSGADRTGQREERAGTTPNKAPFAVMTMLAGTGSQISATRSRTPTPAAKVPRESSHADGSISRGISSASAIPNITRKMNATMQTAVQ